MYAVCEAQLGLKMNCLYLLRGVEDMLVPVGGIRYVFRSRGQSETRAANVESDTVEEQNSKTKQSEAQRRVNLYTNSQSFIEEQVMST